MLENVSHAASSPGQVAARARQDADSMPARENALRASIPLHAELTNAAADMSAMRQHKHAGSCARIPLHAGLAPPAAPDMDALGGHASLAIV